MKIEKITPEVKSTYTITVDEEEVQYLQALAFLPEWSENGKAGNFSEKLWGELRDKTGNYVYADKFFKSVSIDVSGDDDDEEDYEDDEDSWY